MFWRKEKQGLYIRSKDEFFNPARFDEQNLIHITGDDVERKSKQAENDSSFRYETTVGSIKEDNAYYKFSRDQLVVLEDTITGFKTLSFVDFRYRRIVDESKIVKKHYKGYVEGYNYTGGMDIVQDKTVLDYSGCEYIYNLHLVFLPQRYKGETYFIDVGNYISLGYDIAMTGIDYYSAPGFLAELQLGFSSQPGICWRKSENIQVANKKELKKFLRRFDSINNNNEFVTATSFINDLERRLNEKGPPVFSAVLYERVRSD